MLRRAVDEVSEMQAEARAEAEAMIAAAEAEIEAEQQKHKELLGGLDRAAQQAWKPSTRKPRKTLEAELAGLRADAQQEREQLLADAKQEADHYREQARRAVDEATRQRIKVLEQLMGVYRDLEAVPATLETAYQELKNHPRTGTVASAQQVNAG